jgi:hypothetical protein
MSHATTLALLQDRLDGTADQLETLVYEALDDLQTTRDELRRRVELKRARDARYRARRRSLEAAPSAPRRVFVVDSLGVAELSEPLAF